MLKSCTVCATMPINSDSGEMHTDLMLHIILNKVLQCVLKYFVLVTTDSCCAGHYLSLSFVVGGCSP